MTYRILRPLLFTQDPEQAHNQVIKLGSRISSSTTLLNLLSSVSHSTSDRLKFTMAKIPLRNPIGLAAGFDKNGQIVPLLYALGFGHIEIGSITAQPSAGNPQPRLFRLPKEQAIINRMGLNNWGVQKITTHLDQLASYPCGINIAKTHSPNILGDAAIEDFITSYQHIKHQGIYTTLNISCPNTTEGKTFEDSPQALAELLSEITKLRNSKPIFLKLSPDLNMQSLEQIIEQVDKFSLDGFIVGNTSQDRSSLKTSTLQLEKIGRGGLSGKPIFTKSTKMVHNLYALTAGKYPIIGTGGIMSVDDIIEKIKHGASAVQILTGIIYNGPRWISQLNNQLDYYLQQHQLTITELKGVYHDR